MANKDMDVWSKEEIDFVKMVDESLERNYPGITSVRKSIDIEEIGKNHQEHLAYCLDKMTQSEKDAISSVIDDHREYMIDIKENETEFTSYHEKIMSDINIIKPWISDGDGFKYER